MRIDVLTIFPDVVEHFASRSLLGKARERGTLEVRVHDLRSAAVGHRPHRVVCEQIDVLVDVARIAEVCDQRDEIANLELGRDAREWLIRSCHAHAIGSRSRARKTTESRHVKSSEAKRSAG